MSSMIYYDTKSQPWHQWRHGTPVWHQMTISEWCAMSPNTSKNHFPSAFKKIDFGHLGTHLVIPRPQGTLHDVNVCSSDAKWRQTTKVVWVMHCECDITIMCKKLIFDHVCTHFMTPEMSWHDLQWRQIFLHLPSDTMTAAWRQNDEQWHQDSVRRVIDLVKSASMNKL